MYDYRVQRANLFTERGSLMYQRMRDRAQHLLKVAGAFRASAVMRGVSGDSWDMLACLDRMAELGELREVTGPFAWGQDRIFTSQGERKTV